MAPRSDKEKNPAGGGSRVRGNLGAIGTAAVLAVYSAGFARTKAAADRFAAEDVRRTTSSDASVPDTSRILTTQVAASIVASSKASAPSQPGSNATSVNSHIKTPGSAKATKTTPAAKPVETVATVDAASSADPVQSEPETPVAPPPAPTVEQPVETPPPARSAPKYKDGTFLGWGSSRHGDIQASVEIRNGVIIAATIVQCRTQYSCSRIDSLPPEVVARQSAEIDYVSRATQSSNAFYYAIVSALSQAK